MPEAPCLRDKIEAHVEGKLQRLNEVIHPNRTTALRVAMAPAIVAVSAISGPAAAGIHALNTGADWLDGAQARAGKLVQNEEGEWVKESLCSKEGAAFDPLADKIGTDGQLLKFAIQGDDEIFMAMVGVNIAVDIISQCMGRGPIINQIRDAIRATLYPETCNYNQQESASAKAGWPGKTKMALQSLVIGLRYFRGTNVADWAGVSPEMIDVTSSTGLAVAAVLGATGIAKRIKLSEKLTNLYVKLKVQYPELESAIRMCSF